MPGVFPRNSTAASTFFDKRRFHRYCVSRVVDRRFAFGKDNEEQLRTYMRMYENFSGCRVLAYCFMGNH